MRAQVGGGWAITHLTDRVVELTNDSWAYRRLTGKDGVVRSRCEPGMDRSFLIDRAIQQARRSDETLAQLLGAEIMPSFVRFNQYSKRMATAMMTGEESPLIGVKHA